MFFLAELPQRVAQVGLDTRDVPPAFDLLAPLLRVGFKDFVFIGNAGVTAPGQVRAFQVADGTLILASNDFDSTAEIAIRLDDKMNLSAGDFIF